MSFITRQTFINAVMNFLEDKLVKAALKKVLGSAMAGGFKAWLIKLIVTELAEEVALPVIQLSTRKGLLFYDKVSGSIKYKKIEKAKESGKESEYVITISNV